MPSLSYWLGKGKYMLELKIGEKELKVKFGYRATLQTRLLSKLAKKEAENENEKSEVGFEQVEDLLLFIPEVLLVGLQKNHSDEYGFDYITEDEKEKQLSKVFELVEVYCDNDGDLQELYGSLIKELTEDGFLSKMFREEKAKAEQNAKKATKRQN